MIKGKIKENVILKPYTTFQIGGRAKYFLEATTKNDIIEAIKWAKQKGVPFFILGGGSNLLVSDNGFNGLVIKMKNRKYDIQSSDEEFNIFIKAESGILLSQLLRVCLERGYSGIEWAAGIPGVTLGGAIRGRAGAFGKSISNIIEQVEVLDAKDFETKIIPADKCQFSYKESLFKRDPNLIILSALIVFKKQSQKDIEFNVREVLKYRRANHPSLPSSGCVFKNPSDKISAGSLIQKVGLKGKTIGKARISLKHCNFIVNLGGACSKDVFSLINLAKQKVKEKFSIALEEEIKYVGFE